MLLSLPEQPMAILMPRVLLSSSCDVPPRHHLHYVE